MLNIKNLNGVNVIAEWADTKEEVTFKLSDCIEGPDGYLYAPELPKYPGVRYGFKPFGKLGHQVFWRQYLRDSHASKVDDAARQKSIDSKKTKNEKIDEIIRLECIANGTTFLIV